MTFVLYPECRKCFDVCHLWMEFDLASGKLVFLILISTSNLRIMEFIYGAAAGMVAATFTNPFEVMKIRMQLQGELEAKSMQTVKKYKHVIHTGYVIAKKEGILKLQSGFVPAILFQIPICGGRLGLYQIIDDEGWLRKENGELIFTRTVIAGGMGGTIGAFIGSPLYLIKTHFQAHTLEEGGRPFRYKSTWSGLSQIARKQGIRGLYRGSFSSIPRSFITSTFQLTTFAYSKQFLEHHGFLQDDPLLNTTCACFIAGFIISTSITPFDLISNRIYNQEVDENGKGLLYNNYTDCVRKTWQTEGINGFYKGLASCVLRYGIHTMLCLTLWDLIRTGKL